jgi:polysaccharide pyruvyl transferase WcaK-like protein
MQKSCLHLTGYFDRNFGDDMMMKLVVRGLPEVTFLVDAASDAPLLSEPNVVRADRETCCRFPRLVVTGSGFMINTKASLITELIWYLKGRHPGDYCLGCNMEPLSSPLKRFLIRRKLNQFRLITCRDQASHRWLLQNTRKPEIHCLPDILFSIPKEWLPEVKSPDKLGISMMHRAGDREDCTYYRSMAEIADEWVCKTGKGVLLMAFDTGTEDDVFACRAVRKLMRFPDRAEIAAHTDGTEIPAAFSRCEKIIGARFHSMVLALDMGIPFFPVIFREKTRNLILDLEYPISGCGIDQMDHQAVSAFLNGKQTRFSLQENYQSAATKHVLLLRAAMNKD